MSEPIVTIDLGQLTVEETYIKPLSRLSYEVRLRTKDADKRALLMRLAEEDIINLRDSDTADFLETAGEALEAWEGEAHAVGLIGYADEGWYYIEEQS